jgi:cardiolipin synthase (CMP-forming)
LDPLADKALLIAVYAVLAWMGALPPWLVVLVVLRDALIMVYAMLAALARGFHGAPLPISKINTAAQIVLAAVVLARLGPGWGAPFLTEAGVAVVAVTTVVSGAAYVLTIRRRPIPAGDGNKEMGA